MDDTKVFGTFDNRHRRYIVFIYENSELAISFKLTKKRLEDIENEKFFGYKFLEGFCCRKI